MTYPPTVQIRKQLEIDRYIGLPIFFPIFKHFTIIGFEKKNIGFEFFFFFFFFFLSHTYDGVLVPHKKIKKI